MDEKYFAKKIEQKWQQKWAETGAFEAEIDDEQAEVLPAGDAAVPVGQSAHGPRPELLGGRRRRVVQAAERIQRAASDRLGFVRPAGRGRGDQTRRESARMDRGEHRGDARPAAAAGLQLRLAAADVCPPARVLQIRPVVLPEDVRDGPGVQENDAGQLVRARSGDALERTGERRLVLALRKSGHEERIWSSGS